ncbi:sialate O-acetylesterase [Parvularcula dongshanensis]|uniref:Sialate O-acetylesterase n=1 Tax=Parvularcula dongshanensis TaxID=1173995 RepID=A0A840I5A7_9PROT|nr:sialate O-acetylesterase [Parvularcula dongshanensis]MBB4659463.1 sialate O-acetylesterase [Parvularcula dongshanensis]
MTDHAVLQRGAPIVLTGQAEGAVTVTLGDETAEAETGGEGTFEVELPAMEAGGPYTLTVQSEDGTLTVEDVLIGDVYLCSGQSNMEFPVSRALNPDFEIGRDHSDQVRLLSIPHVHDAAPQEALPDGTAWQAASAETVPDFSAVCYFTARNLREASESPVPMGLIDASWGGSQIEAWIPTEGLEEVGGFDRELELLAQYAEDPDAAKLAFGGPWEEWWRENYDGTEPWEGGPQDEGYKDVPEGEFRDWKTYDDPAAKGHLGRAWYAKTFELTEEQAQQGAELALGMFDDIDATWLNGEFVGSTFSWSDPRTYMLPEGRLRAGENTLVINVVNTYGQGGMLGPREDVELTLSDGETVPLGDGWRYDIVEKRVPGGPSAPWESVSGYSTIHNGMVAPLGNIELAGALWYQGESNADHAETYEALLEQLVATWRAQFTQDLPVAVIQLPGYGALPASPTESGWSVVREAERQVALDDEDVGLVVAIDAGTRTDIHPPIKQLVAERTAAVLTALAAGDEAAADGFPPEDATRQGDVVLVAMPTDDLKAISAPGPIAFELCGEDGACTFADAVLDGDRIAVVASGVQNPVEVRYCQGDAPICNLYTGDDTPVAPFRLKVE